MMELNKRRRYINLWRRLRNKYYPRSTPIYLIEGQYPVKYEAGYNWVVGYCLTLKSAEDAVLKLQRELKEIRRYLGPLYKIERLLYKEYDKVEKIFGYASPEVQGHRARWVTASNKLSDLIDLEASRITDQKIPFPCIIIMSSSKNDGPIIYSARAVYAI